MAWWCNSVAVQIGAVAAASGAPVAAAAAAACSPVAFAAVPSAASVVRPLSTRSRDRYPALALERQLVLLLFAVVRHMDNLDRAVSPGFSAVAIEIAVVLLS